MIASPEQTLQRVYEILGRHGAFDQGVEVGTVKWLELFCAQANSARLESQKLVQDNARLVSENRTLHRQVERHHATLEDLEHFQLGLLLIKALDVFASPEAAFNWFLRPSSALGSRRPVDALETVAGREEVMGALCKTPAR